MNWLVTIIGTAGIFVFLCATLMTLHWASFRFFPGLVVPGLLKKELKFREVRHLVSERAFRNATQSILRLRMFYLATRASTAALDTIKATQHTALVMARYVTRQELSADEEGIAHSIFVD